MMEEALKITVKPQKPKDNQLVCKVSVDSADVDAAIASAYKEIANRYSFQGFRKGHTPRPVIDSMIGRDAVLAQATNELINALEPLMLEELDIVPMGEPTYGDAPKLAEEGADYELEATIPVRPEAKLSSYDAPSIQMPPVEATEAEVDQQLELLQSYHMSYEEDDSKRAAKSGDFVQVDIDNVEGGAQFAGNNRMLALDSNGLPEQLEKAIVGMKAGQEKDVEWTDVHTHGEHTHEHAVKLKVKLNRLMKQVTPELDDDFVKKGYGFDTVAELRDAVREEISQDKASSLPGLKEDRVVAAIGEKLDLKELPEEYVNQVFNETAQQFMQQLQAQGMTLDGFLSARGIPADAFIADMRRQSEERARQSLALDALAAKLGLTAEADDIEAEFARAGAEDPEAMVEQFRAAGNLPAIRESIKRTKALNWLVENAKVTEVDEIAERRAAEGKDAKKGAKKASAKKTAKKSEKKDADKK